jgi:hypothetical protein
MMKPHTRPNDVPLLSRPLPYRLQMAMTPGYLAAVKGIKQGRAAVQSTLLLQTFHGLSPLEPCRQDKIASPYQRQISCTGAGPQTERSHHNNELDSDDMKVQAFLQPNYCVSSSIFTRKTVGRTYRPARKVSMKICETPVNTIATKLYGILRPKTSTT